MSTVTLDSKNGRRQATAQVQGTGNHRLVTLTRVRRGRGHPITIYTTVCYPATMKQAVALAKAWVRA